tara:strand:- start:568 stop:1230 length:663 start_codon:yes stop_codon:yes gene_type:complete
MIIDQKFRQRWHAYYSQKRIIHQWLQVELLKSLDVKNVLEIGPYLGLVTAMLGSAGYSVTTLDVDSVSPSIGAKSHIKGDITNVPIEKLTGFDVIICCEMLEHITWPNVDNVLKRLSETGVPWLILSVPYEGFQFGFTLYLNRYKIRRSSFFRKLRFLKKYRVSGDLDKWEPHKWEIGYRGYSLKILCKKISSAGYTVERKEFTSGCRSVFLVCHNKRNI